MKNTMKLGSVTAVAGYLVLLISLFLPYLTASAWGHTESVSHFSIPYIGMISLVLGIAGLAIAVLSVLRGGRVALLVLAILQTVWSVLTIFISSLSISVVGMGMASRSIGFWLFVLATVVILAGAVKQMADSRKTGETCLQA
ncbi:MAG: hypothetical protein IK016_01635 [Lachnospiraceae bacterium]|nr:hypothetical protein [Lachnospiraceae bacterium]